MLASLEFGTGNKSNSAFVFPIPNLRLGIEWLSASVNVFILSF